MARQDVQDDTGGMDVVRQSFGAGRFHSFQPIGEDRTKDLDHLSITCRSPARLAFQLALHTLQRGRQFPFLERRAIAQRSGLARQNRDVVERIVDRLVASESAHVASDNAPKDGFKRYFARKQDCAACPLKPRCAPNQPTRKISRSRYEGARQMAHDITTTDAYVASSYARKKVEMLFAHLKRILGLDRLRLRGPNGARDEFHLASNGPEPPEVRQARPGARVSETTSSISASANGSRHRLFQRHPPISAISSHEAMQRPGG